MPLHRQQFDTDSLLEEVPPPGGEPRLSPARSWWWTGSEWVDATSHPDGAAALAAELRSPLLEPLKPLPHAPVAPLKRLDVPVLLETPLSPETAPEPPAPAPEYAHYLQPVVATRPPAELPPLELQADRWEFLRGRDLYGIGALAAAVLLLWVPRAGALLALLAVGAACATARSRPTRLQLAAAVLAVPELVVGLVLHHGASVRADRIARDTSAVTRALTDAANFEKVAHVYDYTYAGPGGMRQHGWVPPTDARLIFSSVEKFDYCLTATAGTITRTVREDGVVSTRPC